jgi:hypothetical protein
LKFLGEVWARRACAGANQQELTTCANILGRLKKIIWSLGQLGLSGDQQLPVGCALTVRHFDTMFELFNFFDFFFGILRKLGDGRGIWGEWAYNTPVF